MVEGRRLLSLFLLPWVLVALICIVFSWVATVWFDLHTLLAPVLKTLVLLKSFFLKTLPLWFSLIWGLLLTFATELFTLMASVIGGWKFWSAKKLARFSARFAVSSSARFVAVSVVQNLLFGQERKGVKLLPKHWLRRLESTWVGHVIQWSRGLSERARRLLLGLVLCIILVVLGQALIGFSILLFDLMWEIVLWLWRIVGRVWRFIAPVPLRFVPNVIANFFTTQVIPLMSEVLPVIRDDHRVMYMRFNVRLHYRRFKFLLFKHSRAKRLRVRRRMSGVISVQLRDGKTKILSDALESAKQSERFRK